jgi:type II secretory pathway component PulF
MTYYYVAWGADDRRVRGAIEADSREAALGHLRARALSVTALEAGGSGLGVVTWLHRALRYGEACRSTFFRSFATLIGAGISVQRALATLIAQSGEGPFAEVLGSIGADVEQGATLSSAMERHPRDMSRLTIAMIRAGETAGRLDAALLAVAEWQERNRELLNKLKSSLAYPAVVTLAAGVLIVFLLTQTMPAFASLFAQARVPLPLETNILISVGRLFGRPAAWIGVIAGTSAVAWLLMRLQAGSSTCALAFDHLRLSVPVVGVIIAKSVVARFCRTLGSLLHAGVDVVRAIEVTAGVVQSAVYEQALHQLLAALKRGETLVGALEATGAFDPTLLQLVLAGEESGTLDEMLLRLAHAYESQVETALSTLSSVIEPALICALGAVIGTIVASVIIPLYAMIGSIK